MRTGKKEMSTLSLPYPQMQYRSLKDEKHLTTTNKKIHPSVHAHAYRHSQVHALWRLPSIGRYTARALADKWMATQPVSLSGFKPWLGKNNLGDCYQFSEQQIFFLITASKVPALYLQTKSNIFLMFNSIFKTPLL